jgi:hypothetical protein
MALALRTNPEENRFSLTGPFRNGFIDRCLERLIGSSQNSGRVGQGILCEMCDLT